VVVKIFQHFLLFHRYFSWEGEEGWGGGVKGDGMALR
jgi:hypothetical protein